MNAPPRIPRSRIHDMIDTGEQLLTAAGLDATTVSGVVGLVIRGVSLLERLGRVELVEATATESHRMDVDP